MTVLFLSGAESGAALDGDPVSGGGGTGTFEWSTAVKRTGAYSFHVACTTTALAWNQCQGLSSTGLEQAFNVTDGYARFYFYCVTAPAANNENIAKWSTGGGVQKLELRIDSTRKLSVYDQAAALVATGTTVLSLNTWYCIELRASQGTNAAYEVRINGTTEPNLQGTCDQVNSPCGWFRFGKINDRNGQSVEYYYDDILIRDDAFPGPGAIEAMYVTANGSTMQWTGGTGASDWQEVDEVPPTGGIGYVESTAAGQQALFDFESAQAAGISGTINAVLLHTRLVEASSGTSAFQLRIHSGSSNQDNTSAEAPGAGSIDGRWMLSATDPATSQPWTTQALDEIEAGAVEGAGAAVRTRLHWVMLSVDFTPDGGASTVPLITLMFQRQQDVSGHSNRS